MPRDADQVTATFDVLLTSAVNCNVPLEATVVIDGLTVTVTGGGLLTVSVRVWLAVLLGEEESIAWTVKLNCPDCDVVPEIVPLLCRLKPDGSVPEARLQE